MTESDLSLAIAQLPRPLVFTNGVFDLLHVGHVTYLRAARALGSSLLVAINSDVSARRLGKGAGRPINRDVDRAQVVGALACVGAVMLFDDDTPCRLLEIVRPEIYVKGGDYDMEVLAETRLVRSWGGEACAIPFVAGYSTTGIVARLLGERA